MPAMLPSRAWDLARQRQQLQERALPAIRAQGALLQGSAMVGAERAHPRERKRIPSSSPRRVSGYIWSFTSSRTRLVEAV